MRTIRASFVRLASVIKQSSWTGWFFLLARGRALLPTAQKRLLQNVKKENDYLKLQTSLSLSSWAGNIRIALLSLATSVSLFFPSLSLSLSARAFIPGRAFGPDPKLRWISFWRTKQLPTQVSGPGNKGTVWVITAIITTFLQAYKLSPCEKAQSMVRRFSMLPLHWQGLSSPRLWGGFMTPVFAPPPLHFPTTVGPRKGWER